MIRRRALALLGALLASAGASAQRSAWEVRGVPGLFAIGEVANAGDIDGDGFDDVLAPVSSRFPIVSSLVWLSGRDGRPLQLRQYTRAMLGGSGNRDSSWMGSAGDFDNDGKRDWYRVLIEPSPSPRQTVLQIVSTATDRVLFEVTGPLPGEYLTTPICADIDLDGDGRPDVLVTCQSHYALGAVHAFVSTNSSVPYYHLEPAWPGYAYTEGVARIGRMDADSGDDFVVTAVEPSGRGCGIVYSGKTGNVLRRVYGELANDRTDHSAVGTGDIDGDGVPDFALGGGYLGIRGTVRLFSGASGNPIQTWLHWERSFGANLAGGLDLDRDGVPDVLTTATFGTAIKTASVFGLSGRTGTVLFEHPLPLESGGFYSFGMLAALSRPVPDRFPSFVYSDPRYFAGSGYVGRVEAVQAAPPGTTHLGAGCVGATQPPLFGISTSPAGAGRLTATFGTGGDACLLLLGPPAASWGGAALPLDLRGLGMPGCSLWIPAEITIPTVTRAGLSVRGHADVDLPGVLGSFGPTDKALAAQWLCLERGIPSVTDGYAMRLRVMP